MPLDVRFVRRLEASLEEPSEKLDNVPEKIEVDIEPPIAGESIEQDWSIGPSEPSPQVADDLASRQPSKPAREVFRKSTASPPRKRKKSPFRMRLLKHLLTSSIGKKQFVAGTGLLLIGFLLSHLAGNLLMLKSAEAFNSYAEYLEHHPLLIPAEIGLALLFLGHIAMGLKVSYENYGARDEDYEVKTAEGGRTLGSATMKYTGLFTLIFLCVHIFTFRISHAEDMGLFEWTLTYFRMPLYTTFYVFALVSLGIHLSHGVSSAFQTFGVSHPQYTPWIRCAGTSFAIVMTGGFCLLAINGFLQAGG